MVRRVDIPSWSQLLWTPLCLAVCMAGFSGMALGQSSDLTQKHPGFIVAPSFPVSAPPTSAAVGDLNGDGKPDLAITTAGSGSITVFLGQGNGQFAGGVEYTAGTEPGHIQLADLNGDGKLDAVVTDSTTGAVEVLLGNGDGTFGKPVAYPAIANPAGLVVGNFHGNGKIDLVVAGSTGKSVAILLNDGSGHFSSSTSYVLGQTPQSLAVADLNGDRHDDLIAANQDGSVSALLGDGNGGFRLLPALSAAAGAISSVVTADFNGDGKPDLAMTESATGQIVVLLGHGDGTFQAGDSYSAGNNPASLLVADVNGDGVPDLVTVNQASNTFSVLAGNGDGTFQSSIDFTTGNAPAALVAGDFNGDGHPDLAILNSGDSTISVPLGNGDGTFRAARSYKSGLQSKALAVGDLDGNGIQDLVIASFCGSDSSCTSHGAATVFLAQKNGTYEAGSSYPLGSGPIAVALADVNGDSKLDLLAINRTDQTLIVMLGNGDGTLGSPLTYPLGKSPRALAVGDFNGDGKPDLFIASDCGSKTCSQPGEVDLWLGNGNGSFSSSSSWAVGYSPVALAAGDLNGDGKLDLVVANACADSACSGSGTAMVFTGNGHGGFQQTGEFNIGSAPSAIALGGLSGKENSELVVAQNAGNQIAVFHNDGTGNFRAAGSYAAGNGPSSLAIADFDGNGTQDVAVADFQTSVVTVLSGKGDGTLGAATTYSVGTGPEALAAIPAKGGTAASLVSANGNSGSSPANQDITVLSNTSPQPQVTLTPGISFTAPTTSTVNQTVTLTASVTGSGAAPSGTVAFTSLITPSIVCQEATSAPYNTTSVNTMTSDATCTTQSLEAGMDTLTATYSGDMNYSGGTSGTAPITVSKANTTVAVTSSSPTSTVNQSVTFTATVSPFNASVALSSSGTVTFTDTTTSTTLCTNAPITASTGQATCPVSSLSATTHTISAVYNGDSNYNATNPATGITTAIQTVNKASTSVLVTSSSPTSTVNQSVTFTATVSPFNGAVLLSSTGTVTFTDTTTSTTLCTNAPITASTGQATCPISSLTATTHTISAVYNGDSNYNATNPATGVTTATQTVNKANTTVVVTSSSPTSTVNQSVTFTATVSPFNASVALSSSGTVTFTDTTTSKTLCTNAPITVSTGQATCPVSSLTATTHTISAVYNGDSNYNATNPATGVTTATQTVNKANTTTAMAPSAASNVNQPVTFTATVTPFNASVPLGATVAFIDNGVTIPGCGSAAISTTNGQATCTTSSLAGGSHAIVASYPGDTNYNSSNYSITQTVNAVASTTSLMASPAPSTINQAVTFTASVTPFNATVKLTGTVTFTDNGNLLGGCTVAWNPATGIATCTTATLTLGTHNVVASYAGDNSYSTSNSGIVQQKVGPATTALKLTSSAATSTINESVTFTAAITAPAGSTNLSGTVAFTDNGNPISTCSTVAPSIAGTAICTTASLPLGSNTIVATYGSDNNFSSSTDMLTQTVNAAVSTTTINSSTGTNGSTVDQTVTFSATVSAAAGSTGFSGTMTFTDNGNAIAGCAKPVVNGAATCVDPSLTAGSHMIVASYGSDNNFTTSSSSLTQAVNPAASAVAVVSSLNPSIVTNPSNSQDAVTFTATVTPSAGAVPLSGSVTFTNNGLPIPECVNAIPVNPATGTASCTTISLSAGSHTVQAAYGNDLNFTASKNSVVQTVADYLLAVAPSSTVTVTQGFLSAPGQSKSDPFSAQAITLTPAAISGFAGTLDVGCTIVPLVAMSGAVAPQCTLSSSTYQIPGGSPISVTIDTTNGASPGSYTVTLTATDEATKLAHSATPFTVVVRYAAAPLTLVSGATTGNSSTVNFVLPENVSLSGLQCTLVAGPTLASAVDPAALSIGCAIDPTSVPASTTVQAASVTVAITTGSTTTAAQADSSSNLVAAGVLGIPILGLLGFLRGRGRRGAAPFQFFVLLLIVAAAMQVIGCGGSFTRPASVSGTTPPGSYNVLVQGTGSDNQSYQAVVQVNVTR